MADILLQKPAAGQTTTLTPQAEDRLVFEFNSSDATLSRNGTSLVMSFEDGSKVNLADFYQAYTSENMPTFLIEGLEVGGEAFFASLNEELMPAAGNAAATSPQGSGVSVDTLSGTLLGGIDRLGRLDQKYPDTFETQEFLEAAAPAAAPLNTPPTIVDVVVTPDGNENTPEAFPGTVDVIESGVGRDNSGADISDTAAGGNTAFGGEFNATGYVIAEDRDGDTPTFTVQNGTGQYGDFTIDPDTGAFGYAFDDTKANSLNHGDVVKETFTVEVSDGNGGTDTTTVTVTIHGTNDAPKITNIATKEGYDVVVTEDSADNTVVGTITHSDVDTDGDTIAEQKFSVENDATGNSDAAASAGEDVTVEGLYGTLTIDGSTGEYTYTLYTQADGDKYNTLDALGGDTASATEKFDVIITDKHNATSNEVTLEFTVNGTNDVPEIVTPEGGNSFVSTDDSWLSDGTAPKTEAERTQSNAIEFTSVESMDGGKVTIDLGFDADGDGVNESQEFTIHQNADGTWSLDPASVTVGGQYGEFTFAITGPAHSTTGSFELEYNYTQTKPFLGHTETDNDNELQNSAESLDVFIQDSSDGAGQGLNASIEVNINDDGPTITTSWTDTDKTDGNDITVVLGTGTTANEVDLFTFEYGADQEGASLTFGVKEGSEFSIENGTEVWHEGQKIGDIVVDGSNVSFKFNMSVDGAPVDKPYIPDGIIPNIEFTYTVTDGDNDSESGNVTVDVKNFEFIVEGSSVTIDDADATSYTQTGSIDINGYDDVHSVTIGGKDVTFKDGDLDGEQTLTFEGYTVVITGFDKDTGQLSYEVSIDKAYDHDGIVDADNKDGITTSYADKDSDGNADITIELDITVNGGASKDTPSLDITILDDGPTAKNDTDTGVEGKEITGNVITGENTTEGTANADVAGADGWLQEQGKDASLVGITNNNGKDSDWTVAPDGMSATSPTYGTITFQPDGSYTFTPNQGSIPAAGLEFAFGYTVKDADGDTDNATLTVTVENTTVAPDVIDQEIVVDESYLSTGTGANSLSSSTSASSSKVDTWNAPTHDIDGNPVDFTIVDGAYGNSLYDVTVSADGKSLEVTLKGTVAHDKDGATGEEHDDAASGGSITVKVTDGDKEYDVVLNVTIEDDGPVINSTRDDDEKTFAVVENGHVSANLDVDFGADGQHQIIIPKEFGGAATSDIIATWNPDTQQWTGWLVEHTTGSNTLKIGDVTFVQGENNQWTISYDTSAHDRELTIEFKDRDGDSAEHTIVPEASEPDIESTGRYKDQYSIENGKVNWQLDLLVPGGLLAPGELEEYYATVAAPDTVYDKDGFVLNAGVGNDVVQLGKYSDIIHLGDGHVNLDVPNEEQHLKDAQGTLETFMYGAEGKTEIVADSEVLTYNPENGSENFKTFITGQSDAYIDMGSGGDGNDTIYGEAGVDLIAGGNGNDKLYGGADNDGIRGGAGDDLLDGGTGNDILYGGAGNDTIIGGEGHDSLFGGEGDDIIIGDINDTINGGSGKDIMDLNSIKGLDINSVLSVDGGDDMDALLVGIGELESVKQLIESGKITNTEVIMFGGQQSDAQDVLNNIQADKDGNLDESSLVGWNAKEGSEVKLNGNTYREYTSSDDSITILVQTNNMGM